MSLSTRLFLSFFLVSALLFCGIFFYVKGFNAKREAVRAEESYERALSRYNELLREHGQSLQDMAFMIASTRDVAQKRRALADIVSTGLDSVLLRASSAETGPIPFSAGDLSELRVVPQTGAMRLQLSTGLYFARTAAVGPDDSWRLVLLFPLADFERASRELLEGFLVAGLALLLLTTIFSQLLAREITRPLLELRDKVRTMALAIGFEPPEAKGDEIGEMTRSYYDVAKNLQTAFEHKKLALEELETYKAELLRVNSNLHRRLFQVKVLLSIWSERDKSMDVKDFLARFLEALLPGLPFEYGCVIIRPIADMGSETIFAKKIDTESTLSKRNQFGEEETPGRGTQWTDIIDPHVKEFLLRESESCLLSNLVSTATVHGCIRNGTPPVKITVLSLRLKQGEEPLGSLHFLSELPEPAVPDTLTEFLLSLSTQVAAQLQIQALSFGTRLDPLTRLYNRGYLNDRLREEVVRSSRSKQPFSLILLDLDHFKKVNEIHGRQAADEILRGMASLLKATCRGSDAVCRYGGAEVAILLADTPLSGAKIFAENVRKAVSDKEFPIPSGTLNVTVSMGIAEFPAHGVGVEELLAKVEHALLDAKGAGRNSWRTAG